VTAAARLEARGEGFRADLTLKAADGKLRWNGRSLFGEATLRTTGEAFLRENSLRAKLAAEGLRIQGSRLDALRVSVEGGAASHSFSIDLSGGKGALSARGKGRLANGRWDARWRGMGMRWAGVTQSAGPFSTSLSTSGFSVEGFSLAGGTGTLRLDGNARPPDLRFRLTARGFDPGPLLEAFSDVRFKGAAMNADLTINRKAAAFSIRGGLRFTAAEIRAASAGMALQNAVIALVPEGAVLKVKEGSAAAGKKGRLTLDGAVGPKGSAMTAHASRIPFKSGDLSGVMDGDLNLSGPWGTPLVSGTVKVRKAEYKPPAKKLLERKKGKRGDNSPPGPTPAAPPSPMGLDVSLQAGRNLWYKQGDTAVEMKADVKVEKESYGPPRLYGTVETVRGDYFLFGRRFKLQTGSVQFTGETPPDPAISFRALYQAGDIDVTLSAAGTLLRPEISLASNPPLEESDILSVLATGRPMDELGGGEGDGSAAAAAAESLAAGYLSGKVQEKLRKRVPVDVLRLSVQEAGSAALTLGKNVTDRLYVALEQTLGADGESRVRSEYVLTRWLGLEGSSTGQGKYVLDLLFKFGFK
jgi:translocation and assembly module TamB